MEDKLEGRTETIAGINHMAWLLKLQDKNGVDLYPEIREKALLKNKTEKHKDMVRFFVPFDRQRAAQDFYGHFPSGFAV